jgi:hypothetical protein
MNESETSSPRGAANSTAAGRPAGRCLSDFCGRFIRVKSEIRRAEELAASGGKLAAGAGSGRLTSNANFSKFSREEMERRASALTFVLNYCPMQAGVRLRERVRSALLQEGKRAALPDGTLRI